MHIITGRMAGCAEKLRLVAKVCDRLPAEPAWLRTNADVAHLVNNAWRGGPSPSLRAIVKERFADLVSPKFRSMYGLSESAWARGRKSADSER